MSDSPRASLHELVQLTDRAHVFRDREHAGEVLASMLSDYAGSDTVVLAIPAGGVPVAAPIALRLRLSLEVIPVSKILLPWTTEAGCGAVAFDGSVFVDADSVARFRLTEDDIAAGIRAAGDKVERRMRRLRGGRSLDVRNRTTIVVDDGIAAGSTMRAAITALRRQNASRIVVAVPTAHRNSLEALAGSVETIHCANVRGGFRFAVADAYQRWTDLTDDEAAKALERGGGGG
jgi:putative phosphoribosyl transferase